MASGTAAIGSHICQAPMMLYRASARWGLTAAVQRAAVVPRRCNATEKCGSGTRCGPCAAPSRHSFCLSVCLSVNHLSLLLSLPPGWPSASLALSVYQTQFIRLSPKSVSVFQTAVRDPFGCFLSVFRVPACCSRLASETSSPQRLDSFICILVSQLVTNIL